MDIVFDINLITIPIKVWGIWLLLEVFKPNPKVTNLIEFSLKWSSINPGIYANLSICGFGLGLSILK